MTTPTTPAGIALWSPTGGTGCSTIAVATAASIARTGTPCRLINTEGRADDLAAIAGLPSVPSEPGWRLDVAPNLQLADSDTLPPFDGFTVYDAGSRSEHVPNAGFLAAVIPPTYVALRRFTFTHPWSSITRGIIVIGSGHSHALDDRDVVSVTERPVIAHLTRDPEIARRVDAGVLLVGFPRGAATERLHAVAERLICAAADAHTMAGAR